MKLSKIILDAYELSRAIHTQKNLIRESYGGGEINTRLVDAVIDYEQELIGSFKAQGIQVDNNEFEAALAILVRDNKVTR